MTGREQFVLELRRAGATYREIGAALGVHGAQARKIYLRALRRLTTRPQSQTWGGDW